MRIEIYTPEKYPLLESWWQGHGWPPVPASFLPKLGVIASHEDEPHAAAFLYMDNSVGVSMLEWTVTNPAIPPRRAARAICSLVQFLREEAKSLGYGVMLTTCRQPSLARLLQSQGFHETDKEMIHLLTIL